jgi:hypothetical protein
MQTPKSDCPSVAEYVIDRLADLGLDCAFGVPGDYSFPFDDAIDANPRVKWVVCANELNAAYAADGYARIKGAALLSTTYGVGELSALNGVMGAKAHRLPIFHIVGAPSTRIQRQGLITHQTLGDGVFNNFSALSASAACVVAHLTPDNVIEEMERAIREAFRQSAPAYITVPMDLAKMPVIGTPPEQRVTIALACGRVARCLGERLTRRSFRQPGWSTRRAKSRATWAWSRVHAGLPTCFLPRPELSASRIFSLARSLNTGAVTIRRSAYIWQEMSMATTRDSRGDLRFNPLLGYHEPEF